MSENPQGNGDSGGGRYNGLVVTLLILVGVMGAWIMFDSLNTKAPPPSPAKSAPAGEKLADRIQSGMDAVMSRGAAGGHAIQLSPYSEVATAEDVRAKLDKLGIPSSLRIEAHVQVGPFRTHEDAEAARARLKELGVYGGQSVTLKQ